MGSIGDRNQGRTYPLKRPKGHIVPVPRWSLKFPSDITHVYTLYIGVQTHNGDKTLATRAEDAVSNILSESGPKGPFVDTFRTTGGNDLLDTRVWAAYWTDAAEFEYRLHRVDLPSLWRALGDGRDGIGLWSEHFTTPIARLETNYSRLDHRPGLAQIPRTERPGHDTTAYWGAGRDRIPASAHDLFEAPSDPTQTSPPSPVPTGLGQRLRGANYDNMCHIRSGQWWPECSDEEREAYENDLQITLMEGMRYLWEHAEETGTIGLRFAQNLDAAGDPIRETCAAGFHRNWADLERWSSRHKSHLAIFNGAIRHAKRFGEGRKLMTWHEVSILKAGEAGFDYVNCDPGTGVIRWVRLEVEDL